MANETRNSFQSASAISTLTNLNSLADGNIWQSATISDSPAAAIQYPAIKVWYELDWNAAPVAGDIIEFRIAEGDEHASEIWPGNLTEGEAEISTAAAIDNIVDNIPIARRVVMSGGNYTTNVKGMFNFYDISPDWILLIRIIGEALASSGNAIHYRYFEPQGQ